METGSSSCILCFILCGLPLPMNIFFIYLQLFVLVRPLSGTSSFQMTQCGSRAFLYTLAIAFVSIILGKYSLTDRVFPLLVFLCITWKLKNPHLSLRLLCLHAAAKHTTIVANVNKCTESTSRSQRHCVT